MFQIPTKKANLLLVYQCALAVGAVLVFFTNADQFFFMAGMGPPSTYLILMFCVASVPVLLLSNGKFISFLSPVIVWAGCFLTLSMLSFSLSDFSEVAVQENNRRILAVIFILTMMIIFLGSSLVQLWARRAVLIALVVNIVNIILELLNPLMFAIIDFPDRPPGTLRYADRPAGLYIDPNKTAFALVLSMIFCMNLLPPKYRIPFVFLVGIAIFLTFSRGAILCWLIVLSVYSFTGVISGQKILYWGLGIIAFFVVLGVGGVLDLNQLRDAGLLTDDMMGRLEWFQNPFAKEGSADSRKEVAALAFHMFLERPILGNGIGSTLGLSIGISTHNTYLYYMADHGLLGALVLPGLVYATLRNVRGKSIWLGLAFGILVCLWSLFSHTVLEDRFILISFALMAAIATASQPGQKLLMGYK